MYYLRHKYYTKIANGELDPSLFRLKAKVDELEWVVKLNAKEKSEQEKIKE